MLLSGNAQYEVESSLKTRPARENNSPILQVVGAEVAEGVGSGFLEAREFAEESEFHVFGWAVALLSDTEFGFFALFGSRARFEKVRAEDNHHDASARFDGPRSRKI